jgi:hypothetical protein
MFVEETATLSALQESTGKISEIFETLLVIVDKFRHGIKDINFWQETIRLVFSHFTAAMFSDKG